MNKLIESVKAHPMLYVIGFCAVCLAPVMAGRDFTYMNELRYLEITDESLAGGNFFALTNNGAPYADKPPLYFWLMMLCRLIAGKHSMFLLSMLSFIPGMVTAVIMDKWLRLGAKEYGRTLGPAARIASALALCTCGYFAMTMAFLRMDQMMVMFITLSLYSFYLMYSGQGNRKLQSWLMPFWIFMGLFSKGPVGLLAPLVVILAFLILERDWKSIGKYLGFKTFGVIIFFAALWLLGVWTEGGKDYLYELTVHQTVGRAVNAFHHKEPFYYYIYMLPVVVLPYVATVLPQSVSGLFRSKSGKTAACEKFFLTAIWGIFILLSLSSSKIPLYLLPAIPFIVGCAVLEIMRIGWKKWMKACLNGTLIFFAVVGIAGGIFLLVADSLEFGRSILKDAPYLTGGLFVGACAILGAGSAIALHCSARKSRFDLAQIVFSVSVLLAIFTASFDIKSINPYIGYGEVCSEVPAANDVYVLGLKRPENMKVYLGRDIRDFQKDSDALLEELGKAAEEGKDVSVITSYKFFREGSDIYEYAASRCRSVTPSGGKFVINF